MIAVVQRVKSACVKVDGQITGECGRGLAILLGVAIGDTEKDADLLAEKIAKLRIFKDADGKMNLSVIDVGGSCVVVSQFTLLANYKHGNRPDFFGAESPNLAEPLYNYFADKLSLLLGKEVGRGVFGADMMFEILNDGPVTIVMDSNILKTKKQ